MSTHPSYAAVAAKGAVINKFHRKKVAVIGSGSSGIAALWALNRTYHDVYLYEAADRLGGHTNTVPWKKSKFVTEVDTGFMVFNADSSPNFVSFLQRLGVRTQPADFTFGLSRDDGKFEWSSSSLSTLLGRRRNLFCVRAWRTFFDIVRFNQFALDVLINEDEHHGTREIKGKLHMGHCETIGEYLRREDYSPAFRDDYLIPLTAMLWSTSPDKCALDFPITTLVRFMWNNDLLRLGSAKSNWQTLADGGKSYLEVVMKGFPPNHLFLKTPVQRVTNDEDGRVRVHLESGKSDVYDHVIIATHGDQALSLVKSSASDLEDSILGCFKTSKNEAVLHSDLSLMPRRHKAWSSWNYLTVSSPSSGRANIDRVSITYHMNALQRIPREPFGDVLVTLNPLQRPRPESVQGWFYYNHPLFTPSVVQAQKQLRRIQNTRGISYAGAWTGFGHHEDGFRSGLMVAQEHLGAKLPFEVKDSAFNKGRKPKLGLLDLMLRVLILLVQVFVVQLLERVRSQGSSRILSFTNRKGKHLNGKVKS